ncbi:MAG: DUF342 domain-containing protein [Chthonomonadales bacterium]|nr:DUF342 domain-containing protein [Chthonomonadales bacterium]
MSEQPQDGQLELAFDADRTLAYATISPPRPGGRAVTAQALMAALRAEGVVYGIREANILKAVRLADESGVTAIRVVVAQGVLPVNGRDAQVLWKVDVAAASAPLPRLAERVPDFALLPDSRRVAAGQILASIIPARPGTPGRTLTAPLRRVPQSVGRDSPLTPAGGVHVSEDGLQLSAAVDGFLELRNDILTVHPARVVRGDLEPGEHEVPCSLAVTGSMRRGGYVRARGSLTVAGTAISAALRASGDICLVRAGRCTIVGDGDVHIGEAVQHCDIVARGRILARPGTRIVGGNLSASRGIAVANVGTSGYEATRLQVGVDAHSAYRLREIADEIAACEGSIDKIAHSLRPLGVASGASLPPRKLELVQQLVEQRRTLEGRVRSLHGERRQCLLSANASVAALIVVSDTVFPGVTVSIGAATLLVEEPRTGIAFRPSASGRGVETVSLTAREGVANAA